MGVMKRQAAKEPKVLQIGSWLYCVHPKGNKKLHRLLLLSICDKTIKKEFEQKSSRLYHMKVAICFDLECRTVHLDSAAKKQKK